MKPHTTLPRILWTVAAVAAWMPVGLRADSTDGDLYFTRYSGAPNVYTVKYDFDGASTFTLGAPTPIATTVGADGIIFAPDGDLLVGGQGNRVHKVAPDGSSVTTVTAGGTQSYHLSGDPSLQRIWSGGIPGQLAEIPLNPFANGIPYAMAGDDLGVDTIVFGPGGAYYTSSAPNGFGWWGSIDLDTTAKTATTHRILTAEGTHGAVYDPLTDSFILMGDTQILQLDSDGSTILSSLNVPGVSFDQGTVDGQGHLFVADSSGGNLFFLDYEASGLVGGTNNFHTLQFLVGSLDDIAPKVGPGAPPPPPVVPEPATWFAGCGLGSMMFLGIRARRKRSA